MCIRDRDYRLILNTDDAAYGGYSAVEGVHYPWQDVAVEGQSQSIQLYVPARSAQVLAASVEDQESKGILL